MRKVVVVVVRVVVSDGRDVVWLLETFIIGCVKFEFGTVLFSLFSYYTGVYLLFSIVLNIEYI